MRTVVKIETVDGSSFYGTNSLLGLFTVGRTRFLTQFTSTKGLTPGGGGGVLGISRDGYDRMEPKVKTQNNP